MSYLWAEIIVAVVSICLGGLLSYAVWLNLQLGKLNVQMATVQTQVSPLWARVQAQVAADLHHPDPRYQEMDTLLEELENLTISEEGRVRLKALLLERSGDPLTDETQKLSAQVLIPAMDLVVIEKDNEAH